MNPEAERKGDRPADERDQVNPAARRDRPGEHTPSAPARPEQKDRQVPPTQEEPLDPLGPGGIGG